MTFCCFRIGASPVARSQTITVTNTQYVNLADHYYRQPCTLQIPTADAASHLWTAHSQTAPLHTQFEHKFIKDRFPTLTLLALAVSHPAFRITFLHLL